MAKKLFVRRGVRRPRRGGAPYLKYLVIAAIGLLILVVITPYLLKDRSRETASKKRVPERGAITKELPQQAKRKPLPANPNESTTAAKPLQTVGSTAAGAQAPPVSAGSVAPQQAAPAEKGLTSSKGPFSAKTMEGGSSGAPETASARSQTVQPAQKPQKVLFPALPKAAAPAQPVHTVQSARKDFLPKKEIRSQAVRSENAHLKAVKQTHGSVHRKQTVVSAKPAPKPMTVRCANPALCPKTTEAYSVQVGSIFRNLGEAQSLRKRLAAKGYRASVHRVASLGYLVVTSPGAKSKAYTLLQQMNVEGLTNARVVPVDTQAK